MTTLEALWKTLASLALVGTERHAGDLPPVGGELGALLSALDRNDPEGRLLGAAAAVALQRRAGRLPAPGAARSVEACPPDEVAPCPPRAAEHLGTILGGVHREVLPEWLVALAASGRLAPPAHLPALLALGRTQAELRPLILPVLGRRGRWLAALNPDWDYAAVEVPGGPAGAPGMSHEALIAQWETGSRAARRTLLQQLRASNPAGALELLASSWQSERADERATYVQTLGTRLSMADEPFLEAAIDDRSATVRAAAADLLAHLPGSRLAARMAERAAALLRWTPGAAPRLLGLRPGRPARIDVELPEAVDKAAQRDGVEQKGGRPGVGERAWWLAQIVGRTPPSAWSAAFGAPPTVILGATIEAAWRNTLLGAWAEAARRYGDLEWVEALLGLATAGEAPDLDVAQLAALLPAPRQERILLGLLDEHPEPLSGAHPALAPLRAYRGRWSRELGAAVLDSLSRRAALLAPGQVISDWHLRAAIEEFARALPPELAPEAAQVWEGRRGELPYWGEAIQRFESTIAFRSAMLAALAS